MPPREEMHLPAAWLQLAEGLSRRAIVAARDSPAVGCMPPPLPGGTLARPLFFLLAGTLLAPASGGTARRPQICAEAACANITPTRTDLCRPAKLPLLQGRACLTSAQRGRRRLPLGIHYFASSRGNLGAVTTT